MAVFCDRLVWAVMGYKVEIWGWKEREKGGCRRSRKGAGEVLEVGYESVKIYARIFD